jgi:hypothetical protein
LKRVCAQTKDKFQDLNERSGSLTQQKMQLLQSQPSTFVFRDLDQPRQANVMMRGAYDKPGEAGGLEDPAPRSFDHQPTSAQST